MNIKQLKYVLVLAREQNFSRAAEILNISQPSLSQYIKKIEMQMGAELFVRANGYVRLTDAGRVVVETSRKILDLEHRMENDLQDISEYRTGSLIVGTAPYRSAGLMPAAVRAFRETYPGIQVIVREGTTAELLEAAERGEFDLCLTTMPVDERVFACEPDHDRGADPGRTGRHGFREAADSCRGARRGAEVSGCRCRDDRWSGLRDADGVTGHAAESSVRLREVRDASARQSVGC